MNPEEMTPEELYEATRAKAAEASRKERVDFAADVVAMLETPGGKKLAKFLEDCYEDYAKVDPAVYASVSEETGKLEVSVADLGKHYGIATFIRTIQHWFEEQQSLVHTAAVENSAARENGV